MTALGVVVLVGVQRLVRRKGQRIKSSTLVAVPEDSRLGCHGKQASSLLAVL